MYNNQNAEVAGTVKNFLPMMIKNFLNKSSVVFIFFLKGRLIQCTNQNVHFSMSRNANNDQEITSQSLASYVSITSWDFKVLYFF